MRGPAKPNRCGGTLFFFFFFFMFPSSPVTTPLPGFSVYPSPPTFANRREEGQVHRRGLALQPQRKRRRLRRRLRHRLQEDQRQAVICQRCPRPSLDRRWGVRAKDRAQPTTPLQTWGPPADFTPTCFSYFWNAVSVFVHSCKNRRNETGNTIQLVFASCLTPTGQRYTQGTCDQLDSTGYRPCRGVSGGPAPSWEDRLKRDQSNLHQLYRTATVRY